MRYDTNEKIYFAIEAATNILEEVKQEIQDIKMQEMYEEAMFNLLIIKSNAYEHCINRDKNPCEDCKKQRVKMQIPATSKAALRMCGKTK